MFNAEIPNTPPQTVFCSQAQIVQVQYAPPSRDSFYEMPPYNTNINGIEENIYPDQITEAINPANCVESSDNENSDHHQLLLAQLQSASNQGYSGNTEEKIQVWIDILNNDSQPSVNSDLAKTTPSVPSPQVNPDPTQTYLQEGWTPLTPPKNEPTPVNTDEAVNNVNNNIREIEFTNIEPVVNNNNPNIREIEFTNIPTVTNTVTNNNVREIQNPNPTPVVNNTRPNNINNIREIEFNDNPTITNNNVREVQNSNPTPVVNNTRPNNINNIREIEFNNNPTITNNIREIQNPNPTPVVNNTRPNNVNINPVVNNKVIEFTNIESHVNNNPRTVQTTNLNANNPREIEFTNLNPSTNNNTRQIAFTNLDSSPNLTKNPKLERQIAWTELNNPTAINIKPTETKPNQGITPELYPNQSNLQANGITQNLSITPMGINVGKRNVIPSTMIRATENGREAVAFDYWLIPFNDVIQALNYRVTTLDDGQLELRSFASVVRINPNQLFNDPQLGLSFSTQQIRTLLNIPVEFSISEYAVIFSPPWLEQRVDNLAYMRQRQPVSLEGLPKVNANNFAITAIGQNVNITGGGNRDNNYRGDFSVVGSLFGGSIYAEIDQRDMSKTNTWKLDELQYLRQTAYNDVAIGSQPSFWSLQEGNDYTGVTNIQRWGFQAPNTFSSLGRGFSPSERLRSDRIGRNIIGEATPGTLARLVSDRGNFIVGEVLVDSSGIYRFEDVTTAAVSGHGYTGNNNYRVLLYPNGQLTANPEIREATYSTLPGQLTSGTSALVTSLGATRQVGRNEFFGEFEEMKGGIAYRWGANDSLTLGAGMVYDQNPLGLTEMFYQPANIPLRVRAVALIGTEKDGGIDYNANVDFEPTSSLRFNFNSDELSQRVNANWRILPGVSVNSSWNSKDDAIAGGISLGRNFGGVFTSTSVNVDSNRNLRWNVFSRYRNAELTHRGNEITNNTEFIYNFSRQSFSNSLGHSLKVGYDTTNFNQRDEDLITVGWRYRTGNTEADGFAPWVFELGYGVGSQGDGFIASAATTVIPGLYLTTRYQDVSLTSKESSFSIGLSSNAFLQPQLSIGNSRFERLRGEGGLLLKPYFDDNNNGQRDSGEEIYTEETDLLFLINNDTFNQFSRYKPDVRAEGIFFRLAPDTYRLDVDPAGAPIGWKTNDSSFAVEVIAGSYTPVEIPLIRSYTVAGRVADSFGIPLSGIRVEAIPRNGNGNRVLSVTNGAGIYYLEGLEQGEYNLLVDSKLARPGLLELNKNSDSLIELNLGLNDTITLDL
jgi:hypothetical protein